jgi:hypothetical protein
MCGSSKFCHGERRNSRLHRMLSSLTSLMKDERRSEVTWVRNSLLKHCTQLPYSIACDNCVGSRGRCELADTVDRLATRGCDRPGRSPLSPVVRRARGVTTPIHKEGLLFGWDRGLAREKQRLSGDDAHGGAGVISRACRVSTGAKGVWDEEKRLRGKLRNGVCQEERGWPPPSPLLTSPTSNVDLRKTDMRPRNTPDKSCAAVTVTRLVERRWHL